MDELQTVLKGLTQLAAMMERQKHDLPTGFTISNNLMHGPSGIFGAAGVDRDIFSTRIKPRGLAAAVPAMGTNDDSPIVGYLTGFTDTETGAEPTNKCDDPLEAGELKSCLQGAAFGRIARKTKPLALVDIGRRVNRGEFMDLRLVNDPMMESGLFVPGLPADLTTALNREVLARLLTLGSAFENKLYPMVWTGAVANNTGGDGYREFVGLETLVGTGKVDVLEGTSCPSLDSDVKNANYATVQNDTATIFNIMTMVWRFVNHNATHMGFLPVEWVWVMRGDLFSELVDRWPCVYATYRCGGAAATPNNTDAMALRALSDQMRNGGYLTIDGRNIPVIVDDGIPEDTNTTNANVPSGSFASDIYLLPLTVRGGRRVLFFEYFDYSQGTAQAIADARLGNVAYVSDGGRFLFYSQFTNGCFSLAATLEPRIRLLTPQLAGRISNVVYSPLQHFRQPFNDDPYFTNGGAVSRDNSPYAEGDVG